MNRNLKRLDEESVLFFDIETVSANKELDLDSKEFELWRERKKNKETDSYLEPMELQELYKNSAALNMGFNKIVTIGVGYISKGEARIKALQGTEEEILKEFAKISNHFENFVTYNGLYFDIPIINFNSHKYFDITQYLNNKLITSGEKPWTMKFIYDLMDAVKGTHFTNISFDTACYNFGVKSPKGGAVKGSNVTATYYDKGVSEILDYVKQDVFSLINLYKALVHKEQYENFVDSTEEVLEDKSIIYQLNSQKQISQSIADKIKEKLKGKRISKTQKEIIKDILYSVVIETSFDKKDSEEVKKEKKEQIEKIVS